MNAAVLLRQKVLVLAIHGKLTKREKGDEPASALLARIVAEKEKRSAKVGRERASAQPDPISEDEMPFELPKGWAWCRLCDIAEVQLGKMLDAGKNKGSAFKYLANISVRWGSFNLTDLKTTLFTDEESVKFSLRPNDILMCEGGEPGRCAIWTEKNSDIKYQKAIHRIRLFEVSPEYLQLYFEGVNKASFFTKRLTGSTIRHLPRELLMTLPISLPSVAEQRRIISRVKELLAAIDQYSTAMEKISNAANLMEQKVLDLAIRGKLTKREKGDGAAAEIIEKIAVARARRVAQKLMRKEKALPPITPDEQSFDLPEGWAWARLGQLVQLTSGQDLTPNRYNDNKKGIPYLTGASNIQDGNVIINRWTQTPTSCAEKGDLLFTCKGTVGRMAVLNEKKVHIARQIMGLRAWGGINLTYIQYCLTTMVAGLQSIARSMIPGIGRDDLLNKVIPLPPLAEQNRIVERVGAILSECRKIQR